MRMGEEISTQWDFLLGRLGTFFFKEKVNGISLMKQSVERVGVWNWILPRFFLCFEDGAVFYRECGPNNSKRGGWVR